jgi:hypothetical protein
MPFMKYYIDLSSISDESVRSFCQDAMHILDSLAKEDRLLNSQELERLKTSVPLITNQKARELADYFVLLATDYDPEFPVTRLDDLYDQLNVLIFEMRNSG